MRESNIKIIKKNQKTPVGGSSKCDNDIITKKKKYDK